MKIVITGIAGFIGYHAAWNLQEAGHQVAGIDDFNSYYDVHLKNWRAKLLKERQIRVDHGSLSTLHMSDIVKDADVILHLAGYAGVRYSLENPQTYIDNNVTGTQQVINIAEKYQIPVVYASSSSVYGGNNFTEDTLVPHLSNPYAWSKYANECQFKHSKIPASIGFRFFTVYGPLGRPDMALYSFADSIVNNQPITIYNNGDMSRDFTYVQDIINGVQLLIDKVTKSEGHDIYNIGGGKSTPLMRFVELIEENLGIEAIKEFAPMHPADVQHTLADITKIKRLGYEPKTTVEAGITKFISWYKSYF